MLTQHSYWSQTAGRLKAEDVDIREVGAASVRCVTANIQNVFLLHENKYNADARMDVKSTFVCKRTRVHMHTESLRNIR